jgi:hypothetical protein
MERQRIERVSKIRRQKSTVPIEAHASPSIGEFTCVATARADIGAVANLVVGGSPCKQPQRPQRQNTHYREEQVRPVLYEANPDWRNRIPSKAELDPREYLHRCRLAVRGNPDTRHLLRSKFDSRLDKTFKRIRDGR